MTVESHAEVEEKFDVGEDVAVPSLRDLPGVAVVGAPAVHDLDAVYYDTADLSLARARITLRRRTGGDDAGWHLKLPVGGHERQELRLPAGQDDSVVPAEFLRRTLGERRGKPLGPVVRIRTHREVRSLLDAGGRVLAELCDDHVRAERLPRGPSSGWREWEIELVDGPAAVLERASELLLRNGAFPAAVGSKLARALGEKADGSPSRSAEQSAGATMAAYLEVQLQQLRHEDPLVRAGAADSVHKMRVASRRARSALATYAPLLRAGAGDALIAELRWLGTVLGEARDAEVLHAHFDAVMAESAATSPGRREVAAALAAELETRRARGLSNADELLDSKRYARLLGSLEHFLAAPPFAARAERPALDEVTRLVQQDWKRLDRRVRVAASASGRKQRDHALHVVRKAAKRLRYAAESAVPVLGERAETLAASAASIQDLLGDHHDSAVARALLREVSAYRSPTPGGDVVLDRLRGREKERAGALETQFEAAVLALAERKHRGRWLRGVDAD